MDLLKINWTDRARNDPVVNALFGEYIFEKDHIKTITTPIHIQGSQKGAKMKQNQVGRPSNNSKKLRNHTSKMKL